MPDISLDIDRAAGTLWAQSHPLSDKAQDSLDLAWGPQEAKCSSRRAWAYPSPPMSGSPASQKAASDASERPQPATSYPRVLPQDVYRTSSSVQPSPTDSQPSQTLTSTFDPFSSRAYPPETAERPAHGYQRPPELRRPLSYPPPTIPGASHTAPPPPAYMPAARNPPGPAYPLTTRPTSSTGPRIFTSPKSQRKAKGHVASACVPCKRAHLRYVLPQSVAVTS